MGGEESFNAIKCRYCVPDVANEHFYAYFRKTVYVIKIQIKLIRVHFLMTIKIRIPKWIWKVNASQINKLYVAFLFLKVYS